VNAGKVAVLGDGMKFEPMSRNATDSQLIQILNWSDERICSVFHVPGYKVGVGQAPSYNNIEALDRGYYSGCLQSPIEEMEACLDDGLGLDGVSKGVDLDLDGLMRMDTKTQMEALKIGVDAGIIAPNEGRKQVNLPPLDGGDTVYMQQQDFPLDQVRQNKIVQPSPAPAPVPEPAEVSDEDKSLILEAKSIIATQKAIEAMRKAAKPEPAHVV
jgi:phage portal protein BeeE